jgi:hypothetical protein
MFGKYIFIDSMLRVRDCTGLACLRPGFKSGSGAMQRFISRASTVLRFNGKGPTLTPMRTRQYYLSYAKRWIIQVQARVAERQGPMPINFQCGAMQHAPEFQPRNADNHLNRFRLFQIAHFTANDHNNKDRPRPIYSAAGSNQLWKS